jgi:hypothetical protein
VRICHAASRSASVHNAVDEVVAVTLGTQMRDALSVACKKSSTHEQHVSNKWVSIRSVCPVVSTCTSPLRMHRCVMPSVWPTGTAGVNLSSGERVSNCAQQLASSSCRLQQAACNMVMRVCADEDQHQTEAADRHTPAAHAQLLQ